jgi:hypothetical protein
MTNGLLCGPMARLLCGLPMIAYISYLSISFPIVNLWCLWLSGHGNPLSPWLLGTVSLTNLHPLVIGSGILIVFSILLIEVLFTISVTYLTYVSYNFLMLVSLPDAVTQCLLV